MTATTIPFIYPLAMAVVLSGAVVLMPTVARAADDGPLSLSQWPLHLYMLLVAGGMGFSWFLSRSVLPGTGGGQPLWETLHGQLRQTAVSTVWIASVAGIVLALLVAGRRAARGRVRRRAIAGLGTVLGLQVASVLILMHVI